MPDQNQTSTAATTSTPTESDVVVSPDMPAPEPTKESDAEQNPGAGDIKEIAGKVQSMHNILIALSSDPSVDEIAAAIGLSLCLDRAGKRATSIYSGQTPNALEFLRPEETFENTSDILRDFVIALDKNKADHLRYKLDGDYVKIFITPYKSHIDEEDLEFSLGDFNIELVLALNVSSGVDLDNALREHGRVMHDAVVVNITNGNPGKFGDIEWSDKTKSSICEMVASLLYELGGKDALEPEEATALLTGIVAATDHFSNNSTTADSLQMGSRLMNSGADRELISENIGLDSQNMFFQPSKQTEEPTEDSIDIDHSDTSNSSKNNSNTSTDKTDSEEKSQSKDSAENNPESEDDDKNSELLLDLQKAANDIVEAETAIKPDDTTATESETPNLETTPNPGATPSTEPKSEMVINPSESFLSGDSSSSSSKYEKMLEDALAEPSPNPVEPNSNPIETTPNPVDPISNPAETAPIAPPINPAVSAAPSVPTTPEVNGVPSINYMPMPDEQILPPPPTPPVDFNQVMPTT